MNDSELDVPLILIAILVVMGSLYGTYRLGRKLERRALTGALIVEIENAYYDGQRSAYIKCREEQR